MTTREAINRLSVLKPDLERMGVKSLRIFGSVARNEATPDSDLDIVAEFVEPHTSKQYFDVLFFLEDSLGVKVDLAEPRTLHPRLRSKILEEAVLVA